MDIKNKEFIITKLAYESVTTPFDCGDADLNDFLVNDALTYQNERLAVTHLLKCRDNENELIAGYFCLLTDKLMFDPSNDNQRKIWKLFNKRNKIHFKKHRKSYPAIKIGRLAIAKIFAGEGLGRYLINQILGEIINIDSIACRFITVDAYRNAFNFYLKNGFDFLSSDDENDTTRAMYLDIKRLII